MLAVLTSPEVCDHLWKDPDPRTRTDCGSNLWGMSRAALGMAPGTHGVTPHVCCSPVIPGLSPACPRCLHPPRSPCPFPSCWESQRHRAEPGFLNVNCNLTFVMVTRALMIFWLLAEGGEEMVRDGDVRSVRLGEKRGDAAGCRSIPRTSPPGSPGLGGLDMNIFHRSFPTGGGGAVSPMGSCCSSLLFR